MVQGVKFKDIDLGDNFEILTYEKPKDFMTQLMENPDPSKKKVVEPKRLQLSKLD